MKNHNHHQFLTLRRKKNLSICKLLREHLLKAELQPFSLEMIMRKMNSLALILSLGILESMHGQVIKLIARMIVNGKQRLITLLLEMHPRGLWLKDAVATRMIIRKGRHPNRLSFLGLRERMLGPKTKTDSPITTSGATKPAILLMGHPSHSQPGLWGNVNGKEIHGTKMPPDLFLGTNMKQLGLRTRETTHMSGNGRLRPTISLPEILPPGLLL